MIRRKKLVGTVEVFNMAVGSADGSLEFWHNEEHSADHRVATAQFKTSRPSNEQITTVTVTSVDNFVAARALRNISFIKMDVQGYELAVCEGMRELGFEPSALLDFFRSAGYQLHILTRSATTLAVDNAAIEQLADAAGYVDVLCSRKTLT